MKIPLGEQSTVTTMSRRWQYGLFMGLSAMAVLLTVTTYYLTGWNLYSAPPPQAISIKKDYTDLIYANRNLFYGPWQAIIPDQVQVGEEFEMIFICTHPDPKLCPTYYMVQFRGPTIQAPTPDAFSALNWTYNVPYDYAYLKVNYTIYDPGEYQVYVYPELYHCSQWNNLEFPWQRAAVQGTPFSLVVTGPPPVESYDTCQTVQQIQNGRYVRIASASHEFKQMYSHSGREYIYAPYTCKIPARTITDTLSLLPSAKNIIWAGDSVTRNPFCRRIWWTVHRTVKDGPCDPEPESFHHEHKTTEVQIGNRTVLLNFLWSPHWGGFPRDTVLNSHPPPTHLIFSCGLWIPEDKPQDLANNFKQALEWFRDKVPTLEHVVIKTPASVVQTVDCRGKDFRPKENKPSESLDFRFGVNLKRHPIIQVAKNWNEQHQDGFKVSVIDAFWLTDSRPETTSDGRHYSSPEERPWYAVERPLMGEADAAIDDWVFDEFVTGRSAL